ncbi:MAG: ArnT family glycosyltransferase [Candidatus Nitrospinota bacterium M3_3B_026]
MTAKDMTGGAARSRAETLRRVFTLAVSVFIAAKASLLFLLSYNSLFVMDEYHHAGFSAMIPEGFYENYFPLKTVLFAYFYRPALWLGVNSVEVMMAARIQTALLALCSVGLVYAVSRNMGRGRAESLFNIAVLLAFSTFMERAFRVRAEPLSLFFALAALLVLTRRLEGLRGPFAAGLLSGLSFLTTQKAVYFNAALGLGLVVERLLRRDYKGAARGAAVYAAGWAAPIIVYAVYFRGLEFFGVIGHIFTAPARLALHGGEYYTNLHEFIYITLTRDFLAYAACFAGMAVALLRIRRISGPARTALVSAAAMTFFVFNHNQPWPYVFIMVIPFISLFASEVFSLPALAGGGVRPAVMLIALAALSPSFGRNVKYFAHTNLLQNQTALQAESLLAPGDRYCDGVGMIVTRPAAKPAWWDARMLGLIRNGAERGDYSTLDKVFSREPKVWILNYRVEKLKDVLARYFEGAYVRIYPNVLVSGAALELGGETLFVNRWSGVYRLYGPRGEKLGGRLVVDGAEADQPLRLAAGEYSIRLVEGEGRAFLLPDGITAPFSIPPPSNPRVLYPMVYKF